MKINVKAAEPEMVELRSLRLGQAMFLEDTGAIFIKVYQSASGPAWYMRIGSAAATFWSDTDFPANLIGCRVELTEVTFKPWVGK